MSFELGFERLPGNEQQIDMGFHSRPHRRRDGCDPLSPRRDRLQTELVAVS
jgi:hypothetical protein